MVIGLQFKIGLHALSNVEEVPKLDKDFVFHLSEEARCVLEVLKKTDLVMNKIAR